MWVNDKMKEQARSVNLIQFLQKVHPELIFCRKSGEYAYTECAYLTFFKGDDGVYRYCDHKKRQAEEWDYSGDGIEFLKKYVGYSFVDAVLALCEFEEKMK